MPKNTPSDIRHVRHRRRLVAVVVVVVVVVAVVVAKKRTFEMPNTLLPGRSRGKQKQHGCALCNCTGHRSANKQMLDHYIIAFIPMPNDYLCLCGCQEMDAVITFILAFWLSGRRETGAVVTWMLASWLSGCKKMDAVVAWMVAS